MHQLLKCAACGAEVEFPDSEVLHEAVCPGCSVRVRRRPGDDTMAMPVSMMLPEQFHQIDLRSVGKQSEVLQDRYKKAGAKKPEPVAGSDAALAKALESLASSISHLERKLADEPGEEGEKEKVPVLEAGGKTELPGKQGPKVPVRPVVQIDPNQEIKSTSPLEAPVLVRREAALVTHQMLKEKNRENVWTEMKPKDDQKPGRFATLMERAPGTTIAVTLLGMIGLIFGTISLMEKRFTVEAGVPSEEQPLPMSNMGQLWEDDPEAAQAEAVARGFLNAVSAEAAKPFVYQADQISHRLEKLFKPIATPGEYRIALKSRALTPGGQSIFAFRIWPKGEDSRMLVVLPEGKMPKVHWEFFAEVGELSWEEFMTIRPADPVMMRTWVQKSNTYYPPYTQEEWQAYTLHDYSERNQVIAYADRGSGADWQLSKALEREPVKFKRYDAVMAQAEISFMVEMPALGEKGRAIIAEIKRVPSTSWLPRGFASASGGAVK